MLKRRQTFPITLSNSYLIGRREQWTLAYYVCDTIHKCIGETISYVATKITVDGNNSVWDKNQVLVLLGRVRSLSNIMFVGCLEENLDAIKKVLQTIDPLGEHLDTVLEKCNMLSRPDRFIPSLPYKRCEGVPSICCSYVYMVISKKYNKYLLRECVNLRESLTEINSILNTRQLPFQPWLLACYIVGFDGSSSENQHLRRKFLNAWIAAAFEKNLHSPMDVMRCLESVYTSSLSDVSTSDLIIRQIISFQREQPEPNFLPLLITTADEGVNSCVDDCSVSSFRRIPREVELQIDADHLMWPQLSLKVQSMTILLQFQS